MEENRVKTLNKSKNPALVGIVPRKNLWPIIQNQKWYHIPVESAPRNIEWVEYIAFYFPSIFEEEIRCQVVYYAPVLKIDIVKRNELFTKEIIHPKIDKNYYQFHLDNIKELPYPIPSKRWRRIVHIPTSLQKLYTAHEINDLYDTSPLEEKMYKSLKQKGIYPERQMYVKVDNQFYCLDFCVFCNKGNIDIECDGEKYHNIPETFTKDRIRNNQLTSFGWSVLRFSGKEIYRDIKNSLAIIETTISTLDGLKEISV